jgi:hypothetical protein
VNREITESSEVQHLRAELYRANGSDYRISNCDTAIDSITITSSDVVLSIQLNNNGLHWKW